MTTTQERAQALLERAGAIIPGHFVGTSGKHLSVYVAKDRATRLPSIVSALCMHLAGLFSNKKIEAVVAPAVGGIPLSQWTAYHLSKFYPNLPEPLALYVERDENEVDEAIDALKLEPGDKVIVRHSDFILKRGFAKDVREKRVLVVEDILTTGISAKRTVEAVRRAYGNVVAVGALCNGGGVIAQDLGVDLLETLVRMERQAFTEEECADHGLCARGVPVNTEFGHGAEFLDRRHRKPMQIL